MTLQYIYISFLSYPLSNDASQSQEHLADTLQKEKCPDLTERIRKPYISSTILDPANNSASVYW